MNKASKVKFVLGMIAMSSIAALAPAANAATLKSNQALGDILSQAKLNLDSPQQLQASSVLPSLEKLNPSLKRQNDGINDGCTNTGC
jgi:hypothetical protein